MPESPQKRGQRSRRAARGEVAPPPRLRTGPGKRPERTGVAAKESLAEAFVRMGGIAGLVKWGKKNPTEFYRLWARLIPKEDSLTVTQVGVEELLAQLDAQGPANGDALSVVEAAAEQLGLPAPEPLGTSLA